MSAPGPAFQLYTDDFIAGTAEMSAEEVGAYIRLLCYQWSHDTMPGSVSRLARIAGMDGSSFEGIWKDTLKAKFGGPGGTNPRMVYVKDERLAYLAKQTANGKLGGRPRNPLVSPGITQTEANGNPDLTQTVTQTKPLRSPSPSPSPVSSSPVPTEPTKNPATKSGAGELYGKNPRRKKKPTTEQADFVEWFQACWHHHRGSTYTPSPQDFIHAAALLKVHTRKEIEIRADRMMMRSSRFWIDSASISILRSKFNSLDHFED